MSARSTDAALGLVQSCEPWALLKVQLGPKVRRDEVKRIFCRAKTLVWKGRRLFGKVFGLFYIPRQHQPI